MQLIEPIPPTVKLSRANHSLVANFSCCANVACEVPWEKDVNDWIRTPIGASGALDAIALGKTEVWLYFDAANSLQLIGYGSLGRALINVDDEKECCVVPYFGICSAFHGMPAGAKSERYSRRIFQGLIAEVQQRNEFSELFLYVDANNKPALERFYPDFGFEIVGCETEIETGRDWILMRKEL